MVVRLGAQAKNLECRKQIQWRLQVLVAAIWDVKYLDTGWKHPKLARKGPSFGISVEQALQARDGPCDKTVACGEIVN